MTVISWWRYQKETFSALPAPCEGNPQRPVTLSVDIFFDTRLNNGWANNGEAGDLRRRRAHYDATVNVNKWHLQVPFLWSNDEHVD